MGFSGALTLTDLNDFITPSQVCIKPVEQLNKPEKDQAAAPATEIQIDHTTGAYFEVQGNAAPNGTTPPKARKKLEQAQINLNDCLACSGCITSAESVLITLQSHIEVLNFLESNRKSLLSSAAQPPDAEPYKIPVISISPQTLASLAAATSTSSSPPTPKQILRRIRAFCTQSLGFASVFDTTFARHLALREHAVEFADRSRAAHEGGEQAKHSLPMLASSCPGWICYAEKAHAEMLPFISRTKSPQQVMGTLVKHWMGKRWGRLPNEIYHVTVMPCYDKKLEASRADFYNDMYATRDVDCVITTGELELLMKEKEWDITLPVPGEMDDDESPFPHCSSPPDAASVAPIRLPELITHPGTSSGSYLHSIVGHLQEMSPVPLTLRVHVVRGTDYEEFVLSKSGGEGVEEEIVFKGAKCYGFRNLQNVVRRVGRERGVQTTTGAAGKMGPRGGVARRLGRRVGGEEKKERAYDYVEVMACPGGCVNGGGQLKPVVAPVMDEEGFRRDWEGSGVAMGSVESSTKSGPIDVLQNARWGTKEWTKRVEEEYWKEGFDGRWADELALQVYDEVGDERERYFRTEYRAVESDVVGLAVVW